jgi:hypothetical protein
MHRSKQGGGGSACAGARLSDVVAAEEFLVAGDKRVLITAETGRALRVLKDKLPKQIQPLCVSLLGQSGDAFAELNSSVQEITKLYDAWNPGAYDGRVADIDKELATQRRLVAKLDDELLSLREGETSFHSLMNGAYQGTASVIAERVAKEQHQQARRHLRLHYRE